MPKVTQEEQEKPGWRSTPRSDTEGSGFPARSLHASGRDLGLAAERDAEKATCWGGTRNLAKPGCLLPWEHFAVHPVQSS